MTVLLIAGSPGNPSRSTQLLQAAGERLQHLGLLTQTLRLRELPAQALLQGDADEPQIAAALRAVAQAEAVVLATPIYKAAYSGLLKVFLDLLPQQALVGKPTWALASGGSVAHLLALDYALTPVLAQLGARRGVDPVFASDAQLSADQPPDAELSRRLGDGAAELLQQLSTRTLPEIA